MREFNNDTEIYAALSGDGAVLALEQRFSALLQQPYCLSVINATCGLSVLLHCLPQGRVIAPLFTSPATYAAIGHAGHKIVFCDIDPCSLCLSPSAVQTKLDQNVRAIVTVNIFGHQSHLSELREQADELGALLILDAAQSLGTCLQNPQHLSLADAVMFSLGPAKWLGCPDGGLVAVKAHERWEQLVRKTQHTYRQVLDVPSQAPDFEHFNYRINPQTAALALTGLQDISAEIEHFRQIQRAFLEKLNHSRQFEALPDSPDIIFEPLTALPLHGAPSDWSSYNLPIPARLEIARDHNLPETFRQFRYRKVIDSLQQINREERSNE